MVQERYATVDGRETRYLESGRGRPLILLHGFPLSAGMWEPQLDRVPDGWRFIAPTCVDSAPSPAFLLR